MDNLIFSLNATIPVFLMMVLGMIFRKIGLFDEAFITKMNKFVFVVALPALLFEDIGSANFMKLGILHMFYTVLGQLCSVY